MYVQTATLVPYPTLAADSDPPDSVVRALLGSLYRASALGHKTAAVPHRSVEHRQGGYARSLQETIELFPK